MSISPDYIIERRRHKLQIRNWKLASLVLLIILLVAFAGKKFTWHTTSLSPKYAPATDYIASVAIDDIIFEDPKRDKQLESIATNEHIRALIVNVNSPGGTVVGAEKIYNILRKIAKTKPVVIIMGTMATSGGYLISLGGDYIISHNGTITGSIGVILQTAEVTELAKMLGIQFNNFKSGELKATPNPTEKLTPQVQQAIMENITDAYDYFVELVAERRGFTIEEARKIADGRVYSGRQALKLKLVDAVGCEDDALKWLREVKNIDPKLQVKDIRLKPKPRILDIILEDLEGIGEMLFKNKLQGLRAM